MNTLTQSEYRRLKTSLTRAINSKDPLKILAATTEAHRIFNDGVWPDDWHRWKVAHEDALYAIQREVQW